MRELIETMPELSKEWSQLAKLTAAERSLRSLAAEVPAADKLHQDLLNMECDLGCLLFEKETEALARISPGFARVDITQTGVRVNDIELLWIDGRWGSHGDGIELMSLRSALLARIPS